MTLSLVQGIRNRILRTMMPGINWQIPRPRLKLDAYGVLDRAATANMFAHLTNGKLVPRVGSTAFTELKLEKSL
jgi:hypothetical protein